MISSKELETMLSIEDMAAAVAHSIFAPIDCFANVGEGRTHSDNCYRAREKIALALYRVAERNWHG